jgi:hypothetical protein
MPGRQAATGEVGGGAEEDLDKLQLVGSII